MLERILSLLRYPEPGLGLELSPALRRAGLRDATDLAVVDWYLLDLAGQGPTLADWVAAFPHLAGLDKPAGNGALLLKRVASLVERGALVPQGHGHRVADAVLALVPAYAVAREDAEGAREAAPALDLAGAIAELRLDPSDDAAALLRAGLRGLAARATVAESTPDEAADAVIDAEIGILPPRALAIAAAFARSPAGSPPGAIARAMLGAVENLVKAYEPVPRSSPASGLSALEALRVLVLRFAEDLAPAFDPAWLASGARTENALRREEALRRWARYAGLAVRVQDRVETAIESARNLIRADHRRETLFDGEAAHQRRLQAEVERRIAAEKKRRDDQAASYASGRRE